MNNSEMSIVISAPSGAGKSTIIKRVMAIRKDLEFSVSTTTRKIRQGEKNGVNYYFTDTNNFRSMISNLAFAEWAEVHGNYYGTSKKEIDRIINEKKIPVLDVDVQGAKNLKKCLSSAVYIFIIPPSMKVLKERLRGRKTDSEEQINLRLKNAVEEIKEYSMYDYVLVNDDLDTTVKAFLSIIESQKYKRENMMNYVGKILEEKNDNTFG